MTIAGQRAGTTRAAALVDVGAIERNCARLRSDLGPQAALCAVVKADGYGHGALESARAALAGGATWIAVAAATEAEALRPDLPDTRLFVLGALTPGELDIALAAHADITVWRPGFLELVRERARGLSLRPRIHVKYDTGMGRLGERDPIAVGELVEQVANADEVELTGLWTHFATADELDSPFFDEQLARFDALARPLREHHPSLLLHAANSAATIREPRSHFDMVRCGVAIYGLDPFQESPGERQLEPAMSLHSHVADVKRAEPGDSVGYGRRWRTEAPTWIGVLPIGYGDGVRRALTNNAEVLVGGRRYPVVGAISMDNLTVDLGPDTDVAAGAPAVLIGTQGEDAILAEEIAERLATINYEVTCGISSRVPREYVR